MSAAARMTALRVDRATFVSLTFAMAGLGCNSAQAPVVAVNVVDIPAQPPQPSGDAGAVGAPIATSQNGADGAGDHDEVTPVDAGPFQVAPVENTTACGWVDPAKLNRPTAACNEDQGTVGSCSIMKSCSGFPFPKQKCEAYRRFLKPQVAQRALDCLGKLTVKQVCDACYAYRCGDLALKSACPDPAADVQCTQITTKCPAISMTECRTYLAGLNPAGRTKMVSCLGVKSGCGFGIYSCAESLF